MNDETTISQRWEHSSSAEGDWLKRAAERRWIEWKPFKTREGKETDREVSETVQFTLVTSVVKRYFRDKCIIYLD